MLWPAHVWTTARTCGGCELSCLVRTARGPLTRYDIITRQHLFSDHLVSGFDSQVKLWDLRHSSNSLSSLSLPGKPTLTRPLWFGAVRSVLCASAGRNAPCTWIDLKSWQSRPVAFLLIIILYSAHATNRSIWGSQSVRLREIMTAQRSLRRLARIRFSPFHLQLVSKRSADRQCDKPSIYNPGSTSYHLHQHFHILDQCK